MGRKKSRQEKSKMNPDHLKCPVCMEIFDGKVFILKCGHNLCSICLPKLIQHQESSHEDYNDSDDDEEDEAMRASVKCPVCNTVTKCNKKSNGTFEGIFRNVTIESITQDYREKNGLFTSLDKERKDNLLKKGQKMMAELDDKMKFLEFAELLRQRKKQIVQVQNSISTLLDDFNKNWEKDGPQALRKRMDILDEEFSKQSENEVFKLTFQNDNAGSIETPPNVFAERSFSTWKDSANYHRIIIKDGQQVETVTKHVGPIWGQYEAGAKVRRYMESSGMKNWEWTGHWNSEGGTSYAAFQRKINH